MAFIRRVVTGHDARGRAVFVSDGVPPKTIEMPGGVAVSELLVFDAPPKDANAGGDSAGKDFPLHPPAGGATVRVIRLAPPPPGAARDERWLSVAGEDPKRRGWHTTDTLDFEVILGGEIALGLDDGNHALRTGDCVIQRKTGHRWGVIGASPCTYFVVMLRPEANAVAPRSPLAPRAAVPNAPGPRRLVTDVGPGGRSRALFFGPAANSFQPAGPGDVTLTELWQTGGPLADSAQGGDPPPGWELEPLAGGIAFRMVELPAGHDPGEAGWHTTNTIDVDVIVSGKVELALPDLPPVVLGPGEVVIQRATNHRWRPVGPEPLRMASLMFSLPGGRSGH
jgi:quercetin dioxygenase-like cupin family protein